MHPFLARIGVIEQAAFSNYVGTYCGITQPVAFPTPTCECMTYPANASHYPTSDYLYSTSGYRVVFKLVKEVLFVIFVLAAFWPGLGGPKPVRPPWPLLLMATSALAGLVVSAFVSGPAFALLSARSLEFLVIAILAGRFANDFADLSRWLLLLLAIEFVLVLIELVFAMPTRDCPRAYRASGTLVLPSSLGVFAVGAFAFVLAFAPQIGRAGALVGASCALALALAGGSGTGLAMLAAIAGWLLFDRVQRGRMLVAAGMALALVVLAWQLPAITQRADIYDSVFGKGGRVEKLQEVVASNDLRANLIGRGLGVGSNQTALLAERGTGQVPDTLKAGPPFYADSTITWLVVQLGWAGVLAFYLMLGWAFAMDAQARLFYITVALASLTMSIPELFPMNFLLGLALAHSAVEWRRRKPAGQGA
jgi:hypothetical protein